MSGAIVSRRGAGWLWWLMSAVTLLSCGEDELCPQIKYYTGFRFTGGEAREITSVMLTQGERRFEVIEDCAWSQGELDEVGAFSCQPLLSFAVGVPIEIVAETPSSTVVRSVVLRRQGCGLEPSPVVIELP